MLSEPMIEFTRSGEQWIAYSTYGSGPLDVVFVSPIMSNVEVMVEPPQLSQIWSHLAKLGRLILFDRRGAGLSDPAPRGSDESSLDAWSDDLESVLDAVGADAVSLFTFDTGAQYTLTYAAAHPERVRSVALIEPLVPGAGASGGQEVADWMATIADRYWGSGGINHVASPVLAEDPESAAWWARFERTSMSRGTARNAFRDFYLLDVASVVPLVQAPVLIMYASGRLGPIPQMPGAGSGSSALWLGAHLPHASLVEVEHGDLQWWWQSDLRTQMLDAVSTHFSGVSVAPNVDRVLATVVFTDIVGSTERAAALGDARWLEVLEEHDALADRELRRHRGEKIKSTGDGLLAIFDGPSRAVRFAQAMCLASRSLGFESRAGVHTGEIERLGDDIGGIAVHIGQRVSAQAGPGQVLVSRTVVDLVVGSGLHFTDLDDFDLKGVPGKWRLFSIVS
jgi:class 3 adenylate cyclase